jgi:hypothetical protein
VEEKARGRFLTKLAYQGFLMDDQGDSLILAPVGIPGEATIIITEAEPNVWRVTGASGIYTRFYKGKHRRFFEDTINSLAVQAVLEVLEKP